MKAKRLAALLLVVAMLFTFVSVIAACDKRELTNIEVTPNSVMLQVGQKSAKPTLTFTPDDADKEVTWASANTAVATVDGEGIITAVAAGSTKVTVTSKSASDVKAEIQVTVTAPVAPHVCGHVCPTCGKCTDSTCTDPVCADKCPGHEAQEFTPIAEPVAGTYYFAMKVNDDYWYITGQMASTYYFGTTNNKDNAVTVDLVADGDGWLIKQGTRYIEISINGTHINAVYNAAQTANKHWTWNATEKVFVWDDQYIIGNTGTYTNIGGIALSQKGSNHFAVLGTFGGQPLEKPDPESVTLDHTEDMVLLANHPNKYMALKATVLPANAPQDVTWSVSANEAGITVSSSGRISWTETEGEATITATATGTNKSASVKVQVQDVKGSTQADALTVDEAIALLTDDGVEVFAGYAADNKRGFYLTGKVANSEFHQGAVGQNSTWTFDLVGSNGTLSCTTIGSFSEVGGASGNLDDYTVVMWNVLLKKVSDDYTAYNAIPVSATPPAVTEITIDDTAEVQVPLMAEIHVLSVQPANAKLDGTEQWHSDAEGIATVEKQGGKVYVKGVSAGTAHITVTVGEVPSNQCTVTVSAAESANKFTFDWTKDLTADSVVDDIYTYTAQETTIFENIGKWTPGQTEIVGFTSAKCRIAQDIGGFGYKPGTKDGTATITTVHQITKITFTVVPFSDANDISFSINEQELSHLKNGAVYTGKLDCAYEVTVELNEATNIINFVAPKTSGNKFIIVKMILEW